MQIVSTSMTCGLYVRTVHEWGRCGMRFGCAATIMRVMSSDKLSRTAVAAGSILTAGSRRRMGEAPTTTRPGLASEPVPHRDLCLPLIAKGGNRPEGRRWIRSIQPDDVVHRRHILPVRQVER